MAEQVFLTDFGLAKNTVTGSRYTRTGETLGTPAYMSPEQARGELSDLTPASDVWALGCVLYELLANRPAFDGDTPAAVIARVLTAEPPPPHGAPAPVRRILAVCLQRASAARYAHAGTLRDDCRRVGAGDAPQARLPVRRGTWGRLAGAAVVLAVAGTAAWTITTRTGAPAAGTVRPDPEAERWAAQAWRLRHNDVREAERLLARALSARPARHDWRLRLGLLRWARGDDALGAARIWEAVPPSAPEWTRARWLTGLSWAAAHIETQDLELLRRAHAAWTDATAGRGPEVGWSAAGLLLIAKDSAAARAALREPGDWTVSLLRGIVESSRMRDDPGADPADAVAAYGRALADGVPLAWAHNNRGVAHKLAGDAPAAEADYTAALRLRPGFAAAHRNRGALRWNTGNAAGALADYDAAINLNSGDADALNSRAVVRNQTGDIAGAREDFAAALRANPEFAEAWFNRGILRAEQGDLAGARADFSEAIRHDPDYASAYVNRGNAWFAAGDHARAAADYEQAVRIAPASAHARMARGVVRVETGDLTGARADFDAAVRLQPGFHDALVRRGDLRQRTGDPAGAEADYAAALQARPESWEAWFGRGRLHGASRRWPQAEAAFSRVLELQPEDAIAHLNVGISRANQGNVAGALAAYDAALRFDPGYALAYYYRGCLREQQGDRAQALADLNASLRHRPGHVRTLIDRGLLHAKLGDPAAAVADLEQALRLKPDNPYALGALGRNRMRLEDWAGAAKAFRRYLEVAPGDRGAGAIRGWLAECESRLRGGGAGGDG